MPPTAPSGDTQKKAGVLSVARPTRPSPATRAVTPEAGRPPGLDLNVLVGRRPARPDQPAEELFTTALRGYDRRQVNKHVTELTDRARDLQVRAEAAEHDLREALHRLAESPRTDAPAVEKESGFGVRVEKVLRLAEQEASEVRTTAAAEAAALLEQAREAAEKHRHEAEQSLIARSATLDHEAARRTAALNEREQEIADKLAAARQESDGIRRDAERDAAAHRATAEKRAGETQARAEKAAQQQREAADREVGQAITVRDRVREQLAQLHRVLAAELGRDQPPATNG